MVRYHTLESEEMQRFLEVVTKLDGTPTVLVPCANCGAKIYRELFAGPCPLCGNPLVIGASAHKDESWLERHRVRYHNS